MAIACAAAMPASAEDLSSCSGPVAEYRVSSPGPDRFAVELRSARPSVRWDLFFFTPPGRPEGQSESIRELKAYAADGAEVPITYAGEGGWTVAEPGATRLVYEVVADHDLVDWGVNAPGKDEVATRFDDSYIFAGHAFFLLDWDMPRCPVDVKFDLPEGWRVTAPWPRHDDGWRVDDSWGLAQNMFAMGRDEPVTTQTGGLELTWLMDRRLEPIRLRLEAILERLPQTYTQLWGSAPGDRYTIFFMTDSMSDGGAFWNSFAMRLAVPLSPADETSWRHTLGHEVMHLWNRLGKAGGTNVSELEWVNEGFTDYLTIRSMSRAGLLDPDMAEQRLANIVRRYVLSGHFSPGTSLRDAGKEKLANWQLVYGGGALVALLLDAELSQRDPETFGELLRSLARDRGEGYTYERFIAAIDERTAGKGTEIVDWVDSHPDNAAIVARLGALGIDVSLFGLDEAYVRFSPCDNRTCLPPFMAPLDTAAGHP